MEKTESHHLLEEAKFYFLNRNLDEAERILKQLVQQDPTSAEGFYLLGLIAEIRNRRDEAKAYFEKALSLRPDYREAQEHLDRVTEIR